MSDCTQAQIERALAIADQAMFERLQNEAVPIDANPSDATSFALTDASYLEVSKLEHASADLREAVEWLRERGCAEMASDDDGEFVNVLRRPGECAAGVPACGERHVDVDVALLRSAESDLRHVVEANPPGYRERPLESALRSLQAFMRANGVARNVGGFLVSDPPPAGGAPEPTETQSEFKDCGCAPGKCERGASACPYPFGVAVGTIANVAPPGFGPATAALGVTRNSLATCCGQPPYVMQMSIGLDEYMEIECQSCNRQIRLPLAAANTAQVWATVAASGVDSSRGGQS